MSASVARIIKSARDPDILRAFFVILGMSFDAVWRECEKRGWCDGLEGAEYRRVSQEWLEAGAPLEMARFIRRRTNISSEGRER